MEEESADAPEDANAIGEGGVEGGGGGGEAEGEGGQGQEGDAVEQLDAAAAGANGEAGGGGQEDGEAAAVGKAPSTQSHMDSDIDDRSELGAEENVGSEFRVSVEVGGGRANGGTEGGGGGGGGASQDDHLVLEDDDDDSQQAYTKRRNSLLEEYLKQEKANAEASLFVPTDDGSSITYHREGPAPAFSMVAARSREEAMHAKPLHGSRRRPRDERSILDPPLGGFMPLPVKSVLRSNKSNRGRRRAEKFPEPDVKDMLQMRQVRPLPCLHCPYPPLSLFHTHTFSL